MKNLNQNTETYISFTEDEINELSDKIDWKKEWMGELIPVIAQDINTKEILMQAFVNEEAFKNTLESWNATYWSRSRSKIWEKWLTSWATQRVYDINIDCDWDSIIYMVEQLGEVWACHVKDQNSCFDTDSIKIRENTSKDIWKILEWLYSTLDKRKSDYESWVDIKPSYTVKLLSKWIDAILKKISEETSEVLLWAKNNDKENVIYEISDLLYFLNVLMVYLWIKLWDVANELNRREGVSWIEEKNCRKK